MIIEKQSKTLDLQVDQKTDKRTEPIFALGVDCLNWKSADWFSKTIRKLLAEPGIWEFLNSKNCGKNWENAWIVPYFCVPIKHLRQQPACEEVSKRNAKWFKW